MEQKDPALLDTIYRSPTMGRFGFRANEVLGDWVARRLRGGSRFRNASTQSLYQFWSKGLQRSTRYSVKSVNRERISAAGRRIGQRGSLH